MVRSRGTIDLVRNCVCSILSALCPDGLEIIVIHDDNLTDETACELGARGVKLVATSNFETVNLARKMNCGAAAASGDLLVFMNDDVEAISPDWLERLAGHVGRNGVGIVGALVRYEDGAIQLALGEYIIIMNDDVRPKGAHWVEAMLEYAQLPRVGAVGAKLYFPNGSLQYVGVLILGANLGHPYYGAPSETDGYGLSAKVISNWTAGNVSLYYVFQRCIQ